MIGHFERQKASKRIRIGRLHFRVCWLGWKNESATWRRVGSPSVLQSSGHERLSVIEAWREEHAVDPDFTSSKELGSGELAIILLRSIKIKEWSGMTIGLSNNLDFLVKNVLVRIQSWRFWGELARLGNFLGGISGRLDTRKSTIVCCSGRSWPCS